MSGDVMSAFKSRYLILRTIDAIPRGEACLSVISREANITPVIVKQHLAFLQVKDYVTISDFTVENRESLKPRAMSGTPYLLTPKGKALLSNVSPLIRELTSDKLTPELKTRLGGSSNLPIQLE